MKKLEYCYRCRQLSQHKLIAKDPAITEFGTVARVIFAICSLGITESIGADRYFQCVNCGNIKAE